MSLAGRLRTIGALLAHFARRERLVLLLALTGGLSYVAPFLYTLF